MIYTDFDEDENFEFIENILFFNAKEKEYFITRSEELCLSEKNKDGSVHIVDTNTFNEKCKTISEEFKNISPFH